MEELIIALSFSAVGATLALLTAKKMLQTLQLSGYRGGGVISFLRRNSCDYIIRYFALSFFPFCCSLILSLSFPHSFIRHFCIVFPVFFSVIFIFAQRGQQQKQKTPLKITPRIVRLAVVFFLVSFGIGFALTYFLISYPVGGSLICALPLTIPPVVILSNYLTLPIEALIACRYKKMAKRRLSCGIITVGITGSYGKTTAKNILAAMLSKNYRVMASPHSYNTPMGLCKLINNGAPEGDKVKQIEEFDVLIAEMGAKRRGDIAELAALVNPAYGIITVTGTQHLKSFKSVENIVSTKLELAAAAKICTVLNSDDQKLVAAAKNLAGANTKEFLYAGQTGGDACFSGVKISHGGTEFILTVGEESAQIVTPLLGRHIPPLITQCALLAVKMGVPLSQIADACADLQPVPHRLQLIKTQNGAVIDDAFNSNPEGAKNALEILSAIDGERVVITPGFIELGKIGDEENLKLGENIAAAAQYCIAVGNKKVFEGAAALGENTVLVASLDDAVKKLTALNLSRPAVLFLNDLPDNFS